MKKLSYSILLWITQGLLIASLCYGIFFVVFRTEAEASWDGSVAASFASGNGTESSPYLVKTNAQMGYFLNQLASGVTYSGMHIQLQTDLDMTGATWNYAHGYAFEGIFNGSGYTITADCPLFDSIGANGVVKGLNYTTIQTQVDRALLCDVNLGTIDSCVCYGDVYRSSGSDAYASMICNNNQGVVSNCGAIGKVEAFGNDASAYAAMICKNTGTISNCFSALTAISDETGKYNDRDADPLTLGAAPMGCYYDKTLYTGTVTSGFGLTTEQMKSSAFLSGLIGTSVTGTNWVTGSHGYPTLAHCSSAYAFVEGYEGQPSILYHANYKTFALRASNASATIYYTLDGTDPTSSYTRKTLASGKTVTIYGNAVLTMAPYYSGSFGSISQVDITFLPGDGTADNPYQISTPKQLLTLHQFPSSCFKLVSNITFTDDDFDLGGVMVGGWIPVADFSGVLDGAEHAITGLRGQNGGLVIKNSGTITSLRLLDHKLYKYGNFGAIATSNVGTISYCYVRSGFTLSTLPPAATNAACEVGGIVGSNGGILMYCRHEGITLFTGAARYSSFNVIGGICGNDYAGTLSHCINTGIVVLMDYSHADGGAIGGIVGRGWVTNCLSSTDFVQWQTFDYPVDFAGISGWFDSSGAQYCIAKRPNRTCYAYATSSATVHLFATGGSSYCYELENAKVPSDCPNLDFETNWMLSSEGLVPQGVMNADGHCFVPNGDVTYATCTQNGSVPVICLTCNKTENQVLAMNGHSWTEATCTSPITCSDCGATQGEALGHRDENKDHLCDNGCSEAIGAHEDNDLDHNCDYGCQDVIGECSDTSDDKDHVCDYGCGKVLEACADAEGDGDHKCDICDEDGVTSHEYSAANCNKPATCIECGQTTGDALGHSFTKYQSHNNATCTEDGTETAKCDRCDETHTRKEEGSALGHRDKDGNGLCDNGCGTTLVPDENTLIITAQDMQVQPDSTAVVTLTVEQNPGFMGICFYPVVTDANGNVVNWTWIAKQPDYAAPLDMDMGRYIILTSDEDWSDTGLLVDVLFDIGEDVEPGEYRISFLMLDGECFDENENEVAVLLPAITLTVSNITYGDANGDGIVTLQDALLLRRHLANRDPESGTSAVTVDPSADANGDGIVNLLDVLLLRRYLANRDPMTGESSIVLGPQ